MRKLIHLMKLKNLNKLWVFGVTVACAATASSALTLGRARGAILLGQPLGLTVAIQTDADEASAELCFDADVYYGDNRQESSRVSVVPVRSASGAPNAVRITSTTPIDEPVVIVYLRTGCGAKTSRKYVLLSDLVSDLAPVAAEDSSVRAAAPSARAALAAKPTAVSATNPMTTEVKARKSKEVKANRPNTAVVKPSLPSSLPMEQAALRSKSRLKLSILDLVDIKDPDLKLSNELSTLPSDDLVKRDAAGALWRSMNKSTEDIIQDEARQKLLAADVKTLQEVAGKNQRDVLALGKRLELSESQRYANPVIYILAVLLALAAAALIYVFSKLRTARADMPWWSSEVNSDSDEAVSVGHLDLNLESRSPAGPVTAGDTVVQAPPKPKAEHIPAPIEFSNSGLDIDLDLDEPVIATPQLPLPEIKKRVVVPVKNIAAVGIHRDLSQSMHASLHAINTQEMLDVRQQADFFMTLGQHEEAIGLLEASIRENSASNPMVYLDLLKVLHTLSRKPSFDHYRIEFNSIFTGRVQDYATFGLPGNALDTYPQICTEISALWGTEAVVDFLEQCMMRRSEDSAEMYFDLEAFQDLLTLHAVASRLRSNSSSDSGLLPFSAVRASVTPELELVSTDSGALTLELSETTMPIGIVPPPGPSTSVDLDLSHENHNLIDFDASGLTANLPPSPEK